MARPFALIYKLLNSSRRPFLTRKEIVDYISEKFNIKPGKNLKKEIELALVGGVEFGVVERINTSRYRFDTSLLSSDKLKGKSASSKTKSKVSKPKSNKNKPKSRQNKSDEKKKEDKKDNKKNDKNENTPANKKGIVDPIPRPRVMPPPVWGPKRRYLREEPIPRYIHRPTNNLFPPIRILPQ